MGDINNSKKLRVFESFSGYGSQTMALAALGVPYEVVATAEIEPNVIIAYAAMRNKLQKNEATIDEMKELLKSRNIGWDFQKNKSVIDRMKRDKLEMLYNATINANNLGDISKIKTEDIPDHDLFTYSSCCQSFSVSGKGEGGEWICKDCGTIINPFENGFVELCPNCHSTDINKPQSSLLWECVKVIKTKKPSILMMENVKNILSKKHKPTFDKWCEYLESQGYENRYTVLNAQELAIPQNRERMIMISVRKDSHWYSDLHFDKFEFPKKMDLKYCLRDVLQPENEIREKFYLPQHIVDRFQEQYIGKNIVGTTKPRENSIGQRDVIYSTNNIMGTLTATDYKDPKHILLHMGDCEYEIVDIEDKETLEKILKSTPCVVASRGRYNENGTISQHYEANTDKISNTLTTVEKDNYLLDEVNKQDNKEDNLIQIGSLKLLGLLPYAKMHDQSGRVYATNGIAPTITTMGGGNLEPKIMCCVWSDDKEKLIIKYFTIRKLTPIECGRLMGVPNALINKAIEVDLSDSALYHMFGNSIVTTMLMGTFGKLFGVEDYETKIRNLTDGMFGNKK